VAVEVGRVAVVVDPVVAERRVDAPREVLVRGVDAGVHDADLDARALGEQPRVGRVDVGVRRARLGRVGEAGVVGVHGLAGVLERPLVPVAGIVGRGVHAPVGLGVDDVGVGAQRVERRRPAAGRVHELGVGQRKRGREADAVARSQVQALGPVEPRRAPDDDVALRRLGRGRGGQQEQGQQGERACAHTRMIGPEAPELRGQVRSITLPV
jgi:hypothetical protein